MKQSDIWLIEFYPNVGQEISKKRPAIVISDDRAGKLQLRTVVPITDWKNRYSDYPWMIHLESNEVNGLSKESAIDCFQVKNISTQRFVKKIGTISEQLLFEVHQTVTKTFNFKYRIC